MKIAVCIKQVPACSNGLMDRKTGSVIRSSASIVNPPDLVGVELAIQMKEEYGCSVDLFTMGPAKAEEALKIGYAFGADRAFLICDKVFAGSDVLATSYTLFQAIVSKSHYDIIICGSHTTDGDTGLVSGALAEWMKLPFFSKVMGIGELTEDSVEIRQRLENEKLHLKVKLPCIVSVDEKAVVPRIPSLKARLSSKKREIGLVQCVQLEDRENEHYGFAGSATKVKKIFNPEQHTKCELIEGTDEELAEKIVKILEKKEII